MRERVIKERPGPDGWRQMGDFVNNIVAPFEVNLEYDEEQDYGTVPRHMANLRQFLAGEHAS